jgi:hypothetical protein
MMQTSVVCFDAVWSVRRLVPWNWKSGWTENGVLVMTIDLKALGETLTLVTQEQAEAAMAASMAAHLKKYGPPSKAAICLESPVKALEKTLLKTGDDMTHRQIPDDFPRTPDLGSVAGAQPKLLVREVDGCYQGGMTDEELFVRYDACEDLAVQLFEYVRRKISTTGMSRDVALSRAEKGARMKVDSGAWEFSQPELAWVLNRTTELLSAGSAATQARSP